MDLIFFICLVQHVRMLTELMSMVCCRLIHPHRDSLENHIYSEGLEHVREILCTQLTGLCPKHTLHDSGEL